MATEIELETDGNVWKLLVAEGDTVEEGQMLFIMEVMKMEVPYEAPHAGVVNDLEIAEGDAVKEGDIAMVIS
jgi:acetyl-CoA carboxylase biotin carboxyl carrier protein